MRNRLLFLLASTGATVGVAVGVLCGIQFERHHLTLGGKKEFIRGTGLMLVAQDGELAICRRDPHDYAVFNGNHCLVLRESTGSNTFETTYFVAGLSALEIEREPDGNQKILRTSVNFYDESSGQTYTYIDSNGDGLWDLLIQFGQRPRVMMRSNLCWIPKLGK
jgi:hypothetical protein